MCVVQNGAAAGSAIDPRYAALTRARNEAASKKRTMQVRVSCLVIIMDPASYRSPTISCASQSHTSVHSSDSSHILSRRHAFAASNVRHTEASQKPQAHNTPSWLAAAHIVDKCCSSFSCHTPEGYTLLLCAILAARRSLTILRQSDKWLPYQQIPRPQGPRYASKTFSITAVSARTCSAHAATYTLMQALAGYGCLP